MSNDEFPRLRLRTAVLLVGIAAGCCVPAVARADAPQASFSTNSSSAPSPPPASFSPAAHPILTSSPPAPPPPRASEPPPFDGAPARIPRSALPPKGKTIPLDLVPRTNTGRRLKWDPEWRRVDWSDLLLAAFAGSVTLGSAILKPLNFNRPWQGGILFDEQARNTLRLTSLDAQGVARDASDVLLSVEVTGPFLVDALTTAWWYRGSRDVAQQIVVIDLETLAVASAIQGVVSTVTSRERPYVRNCGGSVPSNSIDCDSFSRARSYFSGHTTTSFTSAALVCTHHLNLDLFEYNPTDELACGGALVAAGLTGTLRIMGDEHYASDVLSGAIVGTAVGFGLPWLLHYRRRHDSGRKQGDFTFHLVPSPTGLSAAGTF